MKYFSTFSGIGGFELGIGDEHECVGYSEIDRFADAIYKKHFPKHKNYGDITKIKAETLPDFDLLVGGFPCQAFSIAGKRAGFDDTRGTLFFDLARILKAKRPRYFIFENVKGLLSHDNGHTFKTIISALDELGYDIQWQVLNSKNHGVPQNRERVIIVGHFRGIARPQVFPVGAVDQDIDTARSETRERVAGAIRAKQGGPDLENSYLIIPEATAKGYAVAKPGQSINLAVMGSKTRRGRVSDLAQTVDTRMHQHTMIVQKSADFRKDGTLRKFTKHSPTLRADMGDNHPIVMQRGRGKNNGGAHKLAPTLTGKSYQDNNFVALTETRTEEAKRIRKEARAQGKDFSPRRGKELVPRTDGAVGALTGSIGREHLIAKTVRTGGRGSPHGSKQNWDSYQIGGVIRRLTPTECERLQGFPDGWTTEGVEIDPIKGTDKVRVITERISDTQRYKTLGNAVTVNVVKEVIGRMFT